LLSPILSILTKINSTKDLMCLFKKLNNRQLEIKITMLKDKSPIPAKTAALWLNVFITIYFEVKPGKIFIIRKENEAKNSKMEAEKSPSKKKIRNIKITIPKVKLKMINPIDKGSDTFLSEINF